MLENDLTINPLAFINHVTLEKVILISLSIGFLIPNNGNKSFCHVGLL